LPAPPGTGNIRHSPRNGFTGSTRSWATKSSCHRHAADCMASHIPVGLSVPPRALSLAPTTGARTTRLHRTHQCRSSRAPLSIAHEFALALRPHAHTTSSRPPHPAPRFVTIGRNAPLHRAGMATVKHVFLKNIIKIFAVENCTTQITLMRLEKLQIKLSATRSPFGCDPRRHSAKLPVGRIKSNLGSVISTRQAGHRAAAWRSRQAEKTRVAPIASPMILLVSWDRREEPTRLDETGLVSRTRCSVLHAAPQGIARRRRA
jgi:hypothetical protein